MSCAALGDRSLFPDLAARVYLNHAAISPPSLPVREAVRGVMDDYASEGVGAWMKYRDQREELRVNLATLVGAEPGDLALVPSTTRGVIDIALCLPWRRGDRVVLFDGEFPTNVTPWQRAAARFGCEPVYHAVSDYEHGRGLERLERELERGVRLVAVSAVQFQTGLRMPIPEMAALCHRHGAEIFVDAMQAVGAVPIDVAASNVDYLVAGSHKWLMGIEGAGFAYVAPRCVAKLDPTVAGWLSHEDGVGFLFEGQGHLKYDRPIRKQADFLEVGAMPTAGFAALGASVELLLDVGVDRIYEHANAFNDALERDLVGLGFASKRASGGGGRSCILGVTPPAGAGDTKRVWEGLVERGISCSMPDGVLRFAPHWPNDLGQVADVVGIVRELVQRPG